MSSLRLQAQTLYLSLLRTGPLPTVRSVRSGEPDGPREPLQHLLDLGLVTRDPAGYRAVPHGSVIEQLLSEQVALLQGTLAEVVARQRKIQALLRIGAQFDGVLDEGVQDAPAGDDAALYARADHAQRELMAIHPGTAFPARILDHSLAKAEAGLRSGVRLRVVHQVEALGDRDMVDYLLRLDRLGAGVRLRLALPFRLLVIDRSAALCSMTLPGEQEDRFVVHGRRMVTLMARVFETAWVDATPLRSALEQRRPGVAQHREVAAVGVPGAGGVRTGFGLPGRPTEAPAPGAGDAPEAGPQPARLTPQQQFILRCLAEGEADHVIADKLGVTTRTVARRIAEIYTELQVESRFQAGVAAYRLGLV